MIGRSQNTGAADEVKLSDERVEICAHCGVENPPGLLLCLACGRDPVSGRDLYTPPDIPVPTPLPASSLSKPSYDLTITLPDPILVPDPMPIPTLEDFVAPPTRPHPVPAPVYRAPPPQPKEMVPLLSPVPRWTIGLLGLAVLILLGIGTAGSIVTLNLPGSICLGTLWLFVAVGWLGIVLARRGESRSKATGARRRVVKALGQRLLEVSPSPVREQRAHLPAQRVSPFIQPASELIYLSSAGDRGAQLAQVLLGTLCALVAGDHAELATQTYEVLRASPLKRSLKTVAKTAVSRRTLYVGAGYLERLILEHLRRAPSLSARDLTTAILHQAGADLLERIAAEIAEASPSQREEVADLDAQVNALREFCDELKALNPDLYEQLTQEVEEAVRGFIRNTTQI